MNKSELINILKEESSITRKEAEEVVDTFFDLITDTLSKGDRVEIRGFGSFGVKKYKPYIGRNPKTGEQISVPSKILPCFRVGKELREIADHKL